MSLPRLLPPPPPLFRSWRHDFDQPQPCRSLASGLSACSCAASAVAAEACGACTLAKAMPRLPDSAALAPVALPRLSAPLAVLLSTAAALRNMAAGAERVSGAYVWRSVVRTLSYNKTPRVVASNR